MTENEDLISRSALLEGFRKCYSGHMGMENSDSMMMFKSICRIVNEQEAIGTIEEFKALKEKSVAKKPDYEGDGYCNGQIVLDTWICRNCGKNYEVDYEEYAYCPNCGQHIDHSRMTEDD